ncbi:MAG: hypothetical protein LM587_03095 [Candidatus Aenigmarchaeota archaeon]|nr:hypothetical protein [Candidatus Aenigmarchaeota archaeon]
MEKRKITVLLSLIALIVLAILLLVPYEKIQIKSRSQIQFYKGEKPEGLLEAYKFDVILSEITLLKSKDYEYLVERATFNSSNSAFKYFNTTLNFFGTIQRGNLTKFGDMQKFDFILMDRRATILLKDNKIYYVYGDGTKIDKVVRWAIKSNL